MQTVAIIEILEDEGAYAVNIYQGFCSQLQLPRSTEIVTEHPYDAECFFEKAIKKALAADYSFLLNGENVQILGFNSFLNRDAQNAPQLKTCTQPEINTFRKLR